MFYSHQILARKGPLATVWIAAHLQHRLKKSHYTSTDISSTVDRIMFPDAPIALRMSGHLLLGVVRIYSKKVDYLHHDCNVILIGMSRAFTSKEVNLPESAANAPPESVTLPDRFELDALDLDDNLIHDGDRDRFLRSQEEITLPDQTPVGRDFYVAITFDEDTLMDQSRQEVPHSGGRVLEKDGSILPEIQVDGTSVSLYPLQSSQAKITSERLNGGSDPDARPMEQDTIPPLPVDTNVGFQDPGPSNQTGIVSERINEENSPQSFPDIEVMRDAVHDIHLENFPVWTDLQKDLTEPHRPADQVTNDKEIPSPLLEDILIPGGQSPLLKTHSKGPASATSAEVPEIFDTHISFGHVSPELAIRSTPPVEQPKPRTRKRKLLIDENIVLTNQYMKKALQDSHDLSRKRKLRPGSILGDWKLRNMQRKEQIFDEPSVTAICLNLRDIFKKDYIIAKPHLVISEEAFLEPRVSRSPSSVPDFDMEIEHLKAAQSRVPVPDLDREIERLRVAQSSAPVPDLDMEIERIRVAQSSHHVPDLDMEIERLRDAQSPAAVADLDMEIERIRVAQSSHHVPDLDMEIERLRAAQSPAAVADLDMEIERLRHYEGNAGSKALPEFMPSPSTFMGSPFRRDDFTPISTNTLGSDRLGGTTIGTGLLSTPSMTASTVPFGSEMDSPKTFLEERIGVESTGLSDIPELMNSAEAEDLNFLEADNTPTSSQGTQNVDALCVRTRAVAQFLKRHSPVTQISENINDEYEISLNKILEGKSRKLCARMFFETLVLKSYGLVDVHQEEPYGDINLKLTPTLKAQF